MDSSTDDGHRRMALFFSVEVEFREEEGPGSPLWQEMEENFYLIIFLTLKPSEGPRRVRMPDESMHL